MPFNFIYDPLAPFSLHFRRHRFLFGVLPTALVSLLQSPNTFCVWLLWLLPSLQPSLPQSCLVPLILLDRIALLILQAQWFFFSLFDRILHDIFYFIFPSTFFRIDLMHLQCHTRHTAKTHAKFWSYPRIDKICWLHPKMCFCHQGLAKVWSVRIVNYSGNTRQISHKN